MTETGILNREIAAEISKMGHTDRMMIVDAGLAVPNSTKVIDISLSKNVPTVIEVLEEVLKHFSVEKIIYSKATKDVSPSREKEFLNHFDKNVEVEVVEHPILRDEITRDVKFVIRSGDFTANSNIVLVSAGGPRWYCERED
ncbi:MAG TPA: D-ribose pyranase [Clostridiales bacterium]|nr:D-ribose pyranase [Clostridiales bacterium]